MSHKSVWHLRAFLFPLWECRHITIGRIVLSLTTSIAFVANAEIFRRLIIAIETSDEAWVIFFACTNAGLITASFLLEVLLYRYYWYWLYINNFRYLTNKYVQRYLLLDNEETAKLGIGWTVSIIERALQGWLKSINSHLLGFMDHWFKYIFGLLLIAYIHSSLILPLILTTTAFVIFSYWINAKVMVFRVPRNDAEADVFARIVRIIMEKFTILKNGKIQTELVGLEPFFAKAEKNGLRADRYFVWMDSFPQYILDMGRILVVGIMAFQALNQGASIADITAVLIITWFLSEYALAITLDYQGLTRESTPVWKMLEWFDTIPSIEGYDTGDAYQYRGWSIQFENIDFSYKRGQSVFSGFSLQIEAGKKVAIVGQSGSWKTTLIKLLLGFVRPKSGKIFIDDQNLTSIALKTYYRHIGYLPQEPAVFDGTVYENITYGLPENIVPDDSKVKHALKSAECDFIFQLPDWLQTQIGEKGILLSGWERQRLAIARLFLQDPEIIILDEPTAALDSFSEAKISAALEALCKGKTFIVIAHRLQTVQGADEIFVLQKGCIAEYWCHDELIASNGIYKKMVELQSGIA